MTGTVARIVRYSTDDTGPLYRGFGFFFITDAVGDNRFAHANDLLGVKFTDLIEGAKVEFEPKDNVRGAKGNGLRAIRVRVLA